MNGAESLVHTLLASGISTCFANPGTSEMHFVAALDRIPGMRCVLGLHESVVTGASDGFGRMSDKPAVNLLHCGPGLANGLANLHNARRAKTPIVNIVGDQASYHRPLDSMLASDTEGWARGVSAWTRTAAMSATIGRDAAVAIQAARSYPGQIATLIAPADTCWDEGGVVAEALPVPEAEPVPVHHIREVGRLLRGSEPCFLLLGGGALRGQAPDFAMGIAAATGARVMAQPFNGRVERGRGRHRIERLAYGIDQAIASLAGSRHVILIGAVPPVAPFAYPGRPGKLYPEDATLHVLVRPEQDALSALMLLAEELGVPPIPAEEAPLIALDTRGPINSINVTNVLAALLPEQAVIVDESVSFGRPFFNGLAAAAAHDWLQLTGGAIGSGIPMATGAAIAAPGRRVVSLQADGSAMFTVQGLWTQAREALPITTVILSNRKYAILQGELAHVGANPGRTAMDMLDIGRPDIDWVKLANSLGVEAASADTLESFALLFETANASKGPFLIELNI